MNPYSILKGGFMPNCVMESDISHAAKVCYLALASFAGKGKDTCWPSQSVLAAKYNSNDRSTREHLTELQEAGFIKIRQNGLRMSNTYEFESLEGWEEKNSGVAENRRSGTEEIPAQGPAKNRQSRKAENRRSLLKEPLSYEPLPYTEEAVQEDSSSLTANLFSSSTNTLQVTEEAPDTVTPPPTPSPQPANNENNSFSEEELDLGTEVIKFVQNTYSRKCRVRLTNTALKPLEESIRRAEEDLSKEEFRAALCQYLDTSDDWLRENKWPIRKFLKSPLDYLRAPARPLDSTAHSAIEPGSTGGEIRPIGEMTGTATRTSVPELTSGGISSPTGSTPVQPEYLTYVDKWNTLIPERAVGVLPSFTVDAIQPQVRNQDFALAFDTVVAKCRKLATVKRTEVSFLWLFSKTKDGPIWQQVYMGKYDWLMSPKGGEGEAALSPTQRLIEKKRKEKLAREAAGE